MPFTPFHWGISILIQSLLLILDPVALFVGSVIPDIEGITAWFILPGMDLPLHGPLHSFTGAIFLAFITGIGSWFSLKYVFPLVLEKFHIDLPISIPRYSLWCSLLSAFLGTFSHVILDAFLYDEIDLLYPLGVGNPWNGMISNNLVYLTCVLSFFLGISILTFRFYRRRIKLKGI